MNKSDSLLNLEKKYENKIDKGKGVFVNLIFPTNFIHAFSTLFSLLILSLFLYSTPFVS